MHSWQCKTLHLGQWEKQTSLIPLLYCRHCKQTALPRPKEVPVHMRKKVVTRCVPSQLALELSSLATGTIQSPWAARSHCRSLLLTSNLCLRFWNTVTPGRRFHMLFVCSTVSVFMTVFYFLLLNNRLQLKFLDGTTQANKRRKKEESSRIARQPWGMSTLYYPLLKILKLPTGKLARPPSPALWRDQLQKPEGCRNKELCSSMSSVPSGARGQCHTGEESTAALRRHFKPCCPDSEPVMNHSEA